MKKANRILTVLIFIFLYVPMAVLIVASFNTGKDITQFEGFTLRQYARLFQDRTLLKLLGNSLLVSVLASFIATVFGTVASLGIYNLNPRLRKAAMTLTNIPMTNPDIVTGVDAEIDTSTHGNEASFEFIVEKDPEYIFVLDRDAAIQTEGAQLAQEVMENDLVKGTQAYQNGNIVYLAHPAVWYTAEGGITALDLMLQDLESELLEE